MMGQPNNRNVALNEWIQNVSDDNLKRYIQQRVVAQMEYYSEKSRKCKVSYHKWMTASIFIGFLIPIFSFFSDGSILMKVSIATLGSALTAISSFLTLQDYKDIWERYRYIREQTYSMILR